MNTSLEHHGIKGMRWGSRKGASAGTSVPVHSEDAQRHQQSLDKVLKGGTQALSDKEFKDLVGRMQMQQQYANLTAQAKGKSRVEKGHDVVKTVLGFADTASRVYNLVNSPAVKAGLEAAKKVTKAEA